MDVTAEEQAHNEPAEAQPQQLEDADEYVDDEEAMPEDEAATVAFVPIYGVNNDAAVCYLLLIKGLRLLLDCGWTDALDEELLLPLELQAPEIDAILLSHASMRHLGALPYLFSRLGCHAEVFATVPVKRLGALCLAEVLLCRESSGMYTSMKQDDITAAFDHVTALRYHQTHYLQGELSITAHPSGHDLGGAMWSIKHGADEVVYAMQWTQKDDAHMAGANIISYFQRPTLMIADAYQRAAVDAELRNKAFFEAIMNTLRRDGTVLIPLPAVGRILELLLVLNAFWARSVKSAYPLLLSVGVCKTVMQQVQSLLEWMKSDMTLDLHQKGNPFDLRHVKVVSGIGEILSMGPNPKVVLATLDTMTAGTARDLFQHIAQSPVNAVILPGVPQPGSFAAQLAAASGCGSSATEGSSDGPGPQWSRGSDGLWRVPLTISQRVPLEGDELQEYLQQQSAQQQQERMSRLSSMQSNDMDVDTLTDADGTLPTRASIGVIGKVIGGDVGAPQLLGTPSQRSGGSVESQQPTDAAVALEDVLIEGFTLPKGAKHAMFPFEEESSDTDDALQMHQYGKPLQPGEFAAPRQDDEDMRLAHEMQKEDVEDEAVVPTKVVITRMDLTLRAQVLLFNFDNLVDGPSLNKFLHAVAPQHLVLVGAPKATCHKVREQCEQACALDGIPVQIHTPEQEDVIDCSADAGSAQVYLAASMHCDLRKAGEQYISWVDGEVVDDETQGGPVILPGKDTQVPQAAQNGLRIGQAKLSTVQAALLKAGLNCQFLKGQVLESEGKLLFKIASSQEAGAVGQVLIEGPLSQAYYAARQAIYAQYDVC